LFHPKAQVPHRTYEKSKCRADCSSLLPHIQAVLAHEDSLKTQTEGIAYLYFQGARRLKHTALYSDALEWHEKALAIQKKH